MRTFMKNFFNILFKSTVTCPMWLWTILSGFTAVGIWGSAGIVAILIDQMKEEKKETEDKAKRGYTEVNFK